MHTSRSFVGLPSDLRSAREFARSTAHQWHLDALADSVGLIVTELAANAVVHAHSPFDVVLSKINRGVRVAVCDSSATPPMKSAAPTFASSGRGLTVVDALADRWGHRRIRGGKMVWADVKG